MDKHISSATIRKVWMDPRLTTAEAAAQVGLSRSNLWHRAKALGLPPRALGRKMLDLPADELTRLWNAGVLVSEIAQRLGCHHTTVCRTAHRLGLARRPLGRRPRVTLAEHLEQQLAIAMARGAAIDRQYRKARVAEDLVRGS